MISFQNVHIIFSICLGHNDLLYLVPYDVALITNKNRPWTIGLPKVNPICLPSDDMIKNIDWDAEEFITMGN